MRTILLLISIIIPLSAMAEEFFHLDPIQRYATNLNLKYEPEFDFYFCKNNPALCNALEPDSIIPKLEIRQKASNFTWATFWALQVLDIYSTRKGLQYGCVKEMNPLLPERPSTKHIILHKGIVLGIPYVNNNWKDTVTDAELLTANLLTSVVVLNNFEVVNGARNTCTKIR